MKTNDETYIAAKAILEGKTLKTSTKINEAEENEFSFPKNKKQNYAKFLAANAKRVGKPMIDGGLKADNAKAAAVNGQPVEGVIYCGDGCITFNEKGKNTFIQMNAALLNTSDGTLSWSNHKGFSGNAYISTSGGEFKDIAAALAVAVKA